MTRLTSDKLLVAGLAIPFGNDESDGLGPLRVPVTQIGGADGAQALARCAIGAWVVACPSHGTGYTGR